MEMSLCYDIILCLFLFFVKERFMNLEDVVFMVCIVMRCILMMYFDDDVFVVIC